MEPDLKILGSFLAGCVLLVVSAQTLAVEEPPQVHFVVKSFVVSGNNPFSDSKTKSILSNFTGDHYGLEGLQAAAEALESALHDKGYAFYRVSLIPQELNGGVINLKITEFRINKTFP